MRAAIRLALVILCRAVLSGGAAADIVGAENGGALYVSSIKTSLYPQIYCTSWNPIYRGVGSVANRDAATGAYPFFIRADKTDERIGFDGRLTFSATPSNTVKAAWAFTATTNITVASFSVGFNLSITEFAGGWVRTRYKARADLPVEQPADKSLALGGWSDFIEFHAPDGSRRLRLDFPSKMSVGVQDNRVYGQNVYAVSIRIGLEQWTSRTTFAEGETYTFDYELTLGDGADVAVVTDTSYIAAAGDEWVPVAPYRRIRPDSALDLSRFRTTGLPAGRYGRVVRRGSHFEFENLPGVPQRFYGVNVCYAENAPTNSPAATIADLAEDLARMGYNAIRFHHHEVTLAQVLGDGNADGCSTNLNRWTMDRFNQFAAACVTNGLYLTTDLFVSRSGIQWRALGIDRDGTLSQTDFKRLVLVHEPAFSNLVAFARNFLTCENPYLGRPLAREPALIGLSLVNEGVVSNSADPRELFRDYPQYKTAWNRWVRAKKAADPETYGHLDEWYAGYEMNPFFMQFLQETQKAFFERMRAILRDEIGCAAPLTDMNGTSYPLAYIEARSAVCDYSDDHFYVDHPNFPEVAWQLPATLGNTVPTMNAALGIQACAARRLIDRPYTVTEFNYCAPSPYRSAGGLVAGAMAALQDWDGIWRFSWNHLREGAFSEIGFFRASSDPVQLASERAALCLYLRRDMGTLTRSLVGRIPPEMSTRPVASNARALDAPWRWAGWFAKLGCLVSDAVPGNALDAGAYPNASTNLSDAAVRELLGCAEGLPSDAAGVVGADGAVGVNGGTGMFRVATPRTAGGFARMGRVDAGALSFDIAGGAASVAASSLDGRPLSRSGRILLTHLTDALDTGLTFSNNSRALVTQWGAAPHLMRTGTADIRLTTSRRDLRVYALGPDGSRLRDVPSTLADGVLSFTADIAADRRAATFLYEIAAPPPFTVGIR